MWFQLHKHFIETAACVVYVCVRDCEEINAVLIWLSVGTGIMIACLQHLASFPHSSLILTHTHTDTPYYPHWRGLCSCHSLCLECPSLISNYLNSSDRQNPLPRSPLKTWMEWRRQELCSDSFCLNPGPCPHWLCNLEQVQSPFSSVTLDYTNSCLKVLP